MDVNVKIIEGVEKCPALHGNSCNLDERTQAWTNLAKELKMPVQILKIRWHMLLLKYQRDVNFKYAKNMRFVCLNKERETKVQNWPEFIITEEYFKDDSSEDREEFVFLEADEGDSKCFKQDSSKEEEFNFNEKSEQSGKISSVEFKNTNQDRSEAASDITEDSTFSKQYANKSEELENTVHKTNECEIKTIASSNVEENILTAHVNENESCTKNLQKVVNENTQPLITERCEDVIFGELVSAMLKRMDENKKKTIKREIMNILFS